MSGIKVDVKGNMTRITPENGKQYTLDELQAHVEGQIRLHRSERYYIITNIDGDTLKLPYNGLATCWLIDAGIKDANSRGTALLVPMEDIDLTKLRAMEVAE